MYFLILFLSFLPNRSRIIQGSTYNRVRPYSHREMLTAQTISNKWLAIVLTNGEKPKKITHEREAKGFRRKKSAPTAGRVSISLSPVACVYVSLSFFSILLLLADWRRKTWMYFPLPLPTLVWRSRENLWMETRQPRLRLFFFFSAKKASNNNQKISVRIRNLFYNWQICSPLGWNSFARCF